MKKIIFICTGNTCRSPMAQALAEKIFVHNTDELCFLSRGVSVFEEEDACAYAKQAVLRYEASLDAHVSKQITEDEVKEAFLLVTMTNRHKAYLIQRFPDYQNKICTLKFLSQGEHLDIEDPYGRSMDVYHACCDEIAHCLQNIFDFNQQEEQA